MADLSFVVKAIDQASGTLKGVSSELDHMEGRASRLGGILKGGLMVGAGVAVAGIGALGAVLATSVKEASAAEEVTAQLNAVLQSTGGVAGMTADAINKQALALSEMTRYEDDAIVGAQSLLLTFTKIGKDTFPKATELTLDLATAMKMDLRSAALMMGKALNDPVAGLTAMSRAGVQFTKSQKEMIKAMVEAGDVAGAQRLIMAELETQVGGSARAAGETMAGQMDILKNALGNVKEEIGGALIPVIKSLIVWAGPRLVEGFKKFSAWITTGLADIRQLAGTLGKAKDIVSGIVLDVQAGKPIDWQKLMNLAGLFTNELDVKRAFGNIVKDIETGINNLKTAFDTGGIGGVFSLIWKSIGSFWETDAVPFATEVAGKISAWWTDTLLPALDAIPWASIGAGMQTAWDTLATWWETDAVPFATQVATSISEWFTGQVIPQLKTQAPIWGAELNKILKSAITINGMMISEDASLAYTLGAAYSKLMLTAFSAMTFVPRKLFEVIKTALESGIGGEADWSAVFSGLFTPIGDFLKGALEAVLVSLTGPLTDMISNWWNSLFVTPNWSGPRSDLQPPNQPHGGMGTWLPVMTVPSSPGIPGAGRSANGAGGYAFNITINAPGGNPQAVAVAAQTGVLAAARSMGLA